MKKIFYRSLISFILIILLSLVYLSTVGIKTERFNSKISDQLKKVDQNLEIKLKDVSVHLNLFELNLNAKTIGAELIHRDKVIQLEKIKSIISIKSLLSNKFFLTRMDISTKSLSIKNLISFIYMKIKDPKIYIADKFIKGGYLITNIQINFDDSGNIKNDYSINGIFKEGKLGLFKKYKLDKIDFIFSLKKDKFNFKEIDLNFNNKKIVIPEINIKKENKDYLVSGEINNKNTNLDKNEINNIFKINPQSINVKKINFDSKNNFYFKLNKKYKIRDLKINSEISLNYLESENLLKLKEIFPKIKDKILLKNHEIKLNYNQQSLNIKGNGQIFIQDMPDKIEYIISKKDNEINFNTDLIISENKFNINFLNYSKDKKTDLKINIIGKKKFKKDLYLEKIYLSEKKNEILISKLYLSNNYKIKEIDKIDLNYKDNENLQNKVQINKINKDFLIKGDSFNINKILDNILDSGSKNNEIFKKNFKVNFDVNKIFLDKNNFINDLNGYLFLNKNKITELNLKSQFSNNKEIKLTIKKIGNEQITTLFSNEAKPLVDRYKFIKGFEQGSLDFYSVKNKDISQSTLKIYDFKLKELPVLTKLLTLASLQGIADLLTGEGIRFNEFEMKFSSKENLMTIEEIYAIGPAISILMSGYIEKDNLVSLRGTLVPATTINKTIGSIPVLGNILVGKKTGEGVFGVSFKIKGPPKNLDTTVNPIKTLTPRFITRTLEKLKKIN